MPIYEYYCSSCKKAYEIFHKKVGETLVKCELCGAGGIEKMISRDVGLQFKGSGFYTTDYKNKERKKKTLEKACDKADNEARDRGELKDG